MHGDFCLAICEDHWGDCNDDYRDGCERPISHRVYCEGDPRIHEASPPSIDLYQGERAGPGQLDGARFDRELDGSKQELLRCYERLLKTQPGLEAALTYRITVNAAQMTLAADLITGDVQNAALAACVQNWISGIRLASGAEGGSVSFVYRMVFVAAHVEGEDSAQ